MSKALQQALRCPLLSMSSECAVAPSMHRKRAQQPVWAERGEDRSETFYTIRLVKGQEKVVKRSLSGARTSRKCALHQKYLLVVSTLEILSAAFVRAQQLVCSAGA